MPGLLTICDPADATLDIVFIHGLHGDSKATWTKSAVFGTSIFWPESLLPQDIPDARILSYGYDANIAHFWARPADNRLDTYSNDLFAQLNNKRENTPSAARPLIFVVHSLGGIVLANALVDAASNSYSSLSAFVRGIAFLGTPHRGSSKATWAEQGRLFIAYVKSTNAELSKDLNEKSEKLAKVGDMFPKLLNKRSQNPKTKIEIVCFFEGQPMTALLVANVGKIVEEESATLQGYDSILLNGDHSEISKFASKDDENYQRVVGYLGKWAREFKKPASNENKAGSNDAYFIGENYGLQQHTNSGYQVNNFGGKK